MKHTLFLSVPAAAMMALAPGTASAKTITYRAGPFHMGGFETKLPKLRVRAPHMNGFVTRMNATLHYADGRRVSIRKVMLHHIVFLNDGRPNEEPGGSCKGRKGEPFFGTGEEREQLLLPPGYGYEVEAHDRWRMQTMLMSHSFQERNVYVQYTFTFTKKRLTPVRPFWIRANACATTQPSYSVQALPSGVDHRTFHWKVPMNGRIVAAGGHLHGGAQTMSLTQPQCGDRKLLDTDPLFGPQNDLVYRLRPILHEPGPVGTRFFLSKTGIPVRKGQAIDLQADYDARYPRARVMSIMHVYVAEGPAPNRSICAPLPADRREVLLRHDGHIGSPPYVKIPFNTVGDDGRVHPLASLPGDAFVFNGAAQVKLINDRFEPSKVQIPQGGSITWTFADRVGHNVLFANGPQVVGTTTLSGGASYTSRGFLKAGTYQLFCYLHPVTMHQEVIVTPPDDGPVPVGTATRGPVSGSHVAAFDTPAPAVPASAKSGANASGLPRGADFGW